MLMRTAVPAARLGRNLFSTSKYPILLSPLTLHGDVVLKNRVLMGSMHTGLEEPSGGGLFSAAKLDDMAAFYAERAKGQVGLIVTGGISPNNAGRGYPGAAKMSTSSEAAAHKVVTEAVHAHGGKIAMQILHTGRYAYHPLAVSASAIKSPIGWFTPSALSTKGVQDTVADFINCAVLAQSAGYDGVEVMGSEGYLINQFLTTRTNKRTDAYGGSYANRKRLAVEVVQGVRRACGPRFIIVYRLSMLDLVDGGSSWEEIVELAQDIKAAGASIINTGIGWHEARVPTIATMVPRGAFAWVTQKLRTQITDIPLCTTNRINGPATAEEVLASGAADMVSMARPFLADPHLVSKTIAGKEATINTCIGCNQACLDHIFVNKRASCLVNPQAAHENNLVLRPAASALRIAVVGAGPAGLAAAVTAAQRGHKVTLFESSAEIGGQFNLAKKVPGKEEFYETIRYFSTMLPLVGVDVRLNTLATAEEVQGFDKVVLATGVTPRKVPIPRSDKCKVQVVSYLDVLRGTAVVGERVAIIGAGGIGFDMADYLTEDHAPGPLQPLDAHSIDAYLDLWGIDRGLAKGGGLKQAVAAKSPRQVYLLQRKEGKLGSTLGKTTGWIHKTMVKKRGVEEIGGVTYKEITDEGLVIEVKGAARTLPVDTVVLCAGQESLKTLAAPLQALKKDVYLIGGALLASELDAKRAIDQGTRLAAVIETAPSGTVYNAPEDNGKGIMLLLKKFIKP